MFILGYQFIFLSLIYEILRPRASLGNGRSDLKKQSITLNLLLVLKILSQSEVNLESQYF